jgi:hypothetical protein
VVQWKGIISNGKHLLPASIITVCCNSLSSCVWCNYGTELPASVKLPKDRVKRLESACTVHGRCRCLVLSLTRKRSFPSFFSLTDDIQSVIYHRPLAIICADIFTWEISLCSLTVLCISIILTSEKGIKNVFLLGLLQNPLAKCAFFYLVCYQWFVYLIKQVSSSESVKASGCSLTLKEVIPQFWLLCSYVYLSAYEMIGDLVYWNSFILVLPTGDQFSDMWGETV